MVKEDTIFLQILSDYLNNRKSVIEAGVDWNKIISCARKHQVEGIVYYQCKSSIPNEQHQQLVKLYAANLFYYTNRVKQFEEIAERLSKEKVPFYTVKGLNIAEFYSVPALRTMGDCDIVVHSEDKSRVHDIMISLGYANSTQQDTEWVYYKNRLEFEIHDHLLYDEVVNSQISQDFTELAWEYTKESERPFQYELDWSFHLVFLILHLKKHFLNSGVGFRQFMDLTVVAHNQKIDWIWVEKTLAELDLLDFSKVCFALCEYWFVIKMPLTCDLSDEFIEKSTEKVFHNGVFGFDDESNRKNRIINVFRNTKRIKTLFSLCFPSYNNMRFVPYYSFVNGKPWLLPAAWVYRVYRLIVYRQGSVKLIGESIQSGGEFAERDKDLREWGI